MTNKFRKTTRSSVDFPCLVIPHYRRTHSTFSGFRPVAYNQPCASIGRKSLQLRTNFRGVYHLEKFRTLSDKITTTTKHKSQNKHSITQKSRTNITRSHKRMTRIICQVTKHHKNHTKITTFSHNFPSVINPLQRV